MKSLTIIQILAKIMRVLCIIGFIFCIIGAFGCVLGLVFLPLVQDIVVINSKTLAQYLQEQGVPLYRAYYGLGVGVVSCGVGIFLSKYNELFYKKEIALGTPFDKDFVRVMRVNALVNIFTSLGSAIAIAITVAIFEAVNGGKVDFRYSLFSTLGYGIIMLILSLFCEYGAEAKEQTEAPKE